MASDRHDTRVLVPLLLLAALLALGLQQSVPGQRLDAALSDGLVAMTTALPAEDDSMVFGIDESSMASLLPVTGPWPYQRDVWAHVLDYLRLQGAAHVTLDVVLSEPRPGDEQLRRALSRFPDVALAAAPVAAPISAERGPQPVLVPSGWRLGIDVPASSAGDVVAPRPGFRQVADIGTATLEPDVDGRVRQVPLFTRIGPSHLPSLVLIAARPGSRTAALQPGVFHNTIAIGAMVMPVDAQGRVELRFPPSLGALRTESFSRLARAALTDAADPALSALVRGRRIFIGATATLLDDAVATPLGQLPGVEFVRLASTLLQQGQWLAPRHIAIDAALLILALAIVHRLRPGPLLATRRLLIGWVLACSTAIAATVVLLVVARQNASAVGPVVAATIAVGLLSLADLARLRRERLRLEAERYAAERASELKTRFLNHVAHDLRTPVTAILGFSRLIVDGQPPAQAQAYARVITRNGAHLLHLVNNLLDDATLAVGRARVDLQPVHVRRLVDDVLATLEGLPRHDGVTVAGVVAPAVPEWVLTDALRVRQILINLLANALKFTREGHVELAAAWAADRLTVTVEDTGAGIPHDALARIFEEFEFADADAARAGGSGLGLSVSRRLAELLGGSLVAASTEGLGSCFTLSVPARRLDPPSLPVEPQRMPAAGLDDGPLVLICDDVDDIRQLFAVVLTAAGAQVLLAADGTEALALARTRRPDAIVLDLDLPAPDGLEVVSRLRAEGYAGAIIAVTGGSDDLGPLRAHGFSDAARKPVSSALLVELVARHVGHWEPRRASASQA